MSDGVITRRGARTAIAAVVCVLCALPPLLAVVVFGVVESLDSFETIAVAVMSMLLFWPIVVVGWLVALRIHDPAPVEARHTRLATILFLTMLQGGCWLGTQPIFPIARRADAQVANMRSDLKNLASQQEIYFMDASPGSYSESARALAFTNSSGVIVEIRATERGWTARATHAATTDDSCAIWYGDVSDPMTVGGGARPEYPGEIMCASDPPFRRMGPFGNALEWYHGELRDRWRR